MIKNIAALEVKIGERLYRLICDADSPIGEVHDVLTKMKSHVVKMITDAHEASKPPEDPEQQPQNEE